MSAVRIALTLWGGLYLVLGPLRSPQNGDLYWQRWLGDAILQTHRLPTALGPETFASPGAPWVPQEWLLSVLVALAARHGLFVPLALLVSIVPIGILLSIYFRSRKGATPEAIAIVLLFCGVALAASFGVRAQVLGWGCFAAFLLLLGRNDRWFYATLPVVVIWANVHASVLVAPAYLAARIAGAVADRGVRSLSTSRDLLILPLVILATLCTPLGWHLPAYALMLSASPIRHFIQEWQPVGFADGEFLFGALPLAVLIAVGGLRDAVRNKSESLPIAMLFIAMLLARRNVPLFAIAAAPLAARSLDVRFPNLRRFFARFAEMERGILASVCVAIALTGFIFTWEQREEPSTIPLAAFASLTAGGARHRLFCENFNACSLALEYPNLRVFMDGRCDPYPLAVWRSYIGAVTVAKAWSAPLQTYGVDAVLAQRGSRFANAMARQPSWRRSFEDPRFVVFLRD